MKRTILQTLIRWQQAENRKPLILRGARQVGKTYTVTKLGKTYFKSFIKIDFEQHMSLRKIFAEDLRPHQLLSLIEAAANTRVTIGETLLFFDEIQHCPRALMALRYFYEETPNLHLIAAGSLLEFEMEKISFPVGRVEFLFMYPLTFEEFLLNTGQDLLIEKRPSLNSTEPLPGFLHAQFLKMLKSYFWVGGMPEAVNTYAQEKSLLGVKKIHEQLILSFLQDIPKHEHKANAESLHALLEAIPRWIGQPIKYTQLVQGLTHYKIKQMVHVLEISLLIHRIFSSSAAGLPLGGAINKKTCKFCFIDIGLMQYLRGVSLDDILSADELLSTYQGSLCEQFIGQELIAGGGSQNGKLYYWSRDARGSQAEVDYLLVRQNTILPLEIKKGTSGRVRSLHLFLSEHPLITQGYVLSSANIAQLEKLSFRPLYARLR